MHYEEYLNGYDFEYKSPKNENYIVGKPILSVIIDVFYQLEFVKQSVNSVISQSYPNVELILIDNDAHQEVKEFINDIYENQKNVSLIIFTKNVFSWEDICINVVVCWNAGLKYSRGDFVSHLAYDDMMSSNYAEKMVNLFIENPNCQTASPLAISINENGNINGSTISRNKRNRYTIGLDIALDLIDGNKKSLFSAPGEIFCIRKNLLINNGGFDRMIDITQVLKYGIMGESGFDPDANIFWRSHSNQTNKLSKKKGNIHYKISLNSWEQINIINIWKEKFGLELTNKLINYKDEHQKSTVFSILNENLKTFNIIGSINCLFEINQQCPQFFIESLLITIKEIISFPYTISLMIINFIKKKLK